MFPLTHRVAPAFRTTSPLSPYGRTKDPVVNCPASSVGPSIVNAAETPEPETTCIAPATAGLIVTSSSDVGATLAGVWPAVISFQFDAIFQLPVVTGPQR